MAYFALKNGGKIGRLLRLMVTANTYSIRVINFKKVNKKIKINS